MLGVIAGDVIGSVFEFQAIKTTEFPLFGEGTTFTDDSVLTVATASVLLGEADYLTAYRSFGIRYPKSGYGVRFNQWLQSYDDRPYKSYGNGSAMRVGPVGFAFADVRRLLREAKKSASVTHNHPEGIKGAQATALAVSLARRGVGRDAIRDEITARFGYDLSRTVDRIRPTYSFNETCQGTVPEAIICALESSNWEDAIRKAISLGGDADTLAAIAGGIAEALYGEVPDPIARRVRALLPAEFIDVMSRFRARFGDGSN